MPKTSRSSFKSEWLQLTECEGWLEDRAGTGAFCKACNIPIRNSLIEVRKHGIMAKHKRMLKMTAEGTISVASSKDAGGDASGSGAGAYKRDWEQLAECKGWLEKNAATGAAYCKHCKCDLNNAMTELRRHAKTSKHVAAVKSLQQKAGNRAKTVSDSGPDAQRRRAEYRVALHLAADTGFRGKQELCKLMHQSIGPGGFRMVGEESQPIVETMLTTLFKEEVNALRPIGYSHVADVLSLI